MKINFRHCDCFSWFQPQVEYWDAGDLGHDDNYIVRPKIFSALIFVIVSARCLYILLTDCPMFVVMHKIICVPYELRPGIPIIFQPENSDGSWWEQDLYYCLVWWSVMGGDTDDQDQVSSALQSGATLSCDHLQWSVINTVIIIAPVTGADILIRPNNLVNSNSSNNPTIYIINLYINARDISCLHNVWN